MSDPIRVVIVEDHDMVRDSFVMVMDSVDDIEVVGIAKNLEEGRAVIPETQPNVVIVDFMLPDGSGVELAEVANSLTPRAEVLIITGADDLRAVEATINAGCSGFLSKGRTMEELLLAVRSVAGGAAVFPAGLLAAVTQAATSPSDPVLTTREREVLGLLAQAKNADEIAESLFLSVHTVRNHIRAILTKLGARSQLEALVYGIRQGLVSVEPQHDSKRN